jgi:tRNA(Arg) A34 adenosine deaminase TadA
MASPIISPGQHEINKIDDNSVDYFVEISRPSNVEGDKDSGVTEEAYCILVEPKSCNNVIKELSSCLPLEEGLLHLRRVRKLEQPISRKEGWNEDDDTRPSFPPSTRPKVALQVLLGTCTTLSPFMSSSNGCSTTVDTTSVKNYELLSEKIVKLFSQHGPLYKVMVPKRPPQSEQEWKLYNGIWPTQYYPLKTAEYHEQQKALSLDEKKTMRLFILDAIKRQTVLIVDSKLKEVVADTSCEISTRSKEQGHSPSSLIDILATPVLLSIQGISRLERQNQIKQRNLSDSAVDDGSTETKTRQHQYLCTGYDMYCYYEPCVFEAMACLHSRLRRLVYCRSEPTFPHRAVWRNGCSAHFIHDLPDTNHRYRVFEYHSS